MADEPPLKPPLPQPAGVRVNPPQEMQDALRAVQQACQHWQPSQPTKQDILASTEAKTCDIALGQDQPFVSDMTGAILVLLATMICFWGLANAIFKICMSVYNFIERRQDAKLSNENAWQRNGD